MGKEEANDLQYGCCLAKPRFLRFLNTARWFLFWMFLSNTFISMLVNGLAGVVLTSIETRFHLTSSETGWISSAYELGALPVYVIITLYGTHIHRPRWAGIGLILSSIGSVLFIIPHFTTGVYNPQNSEMQDEFLCLSLGEHNASLERTCDLGSARERSPLAKYFVVFLIARVLQGLGVVPATTGTVTFLDDVTSKEDFSFYISIFITGGVVGPAVGYILGGILLSVYTDFHSLPPEDVNITPADPRWVGAWWLGFLLGAICLFLCSLPFLGYANDLPEASKIREEKLTEAHNADHNDMVDGIGEKSDLTFHDMLANTKHLVFNPTYILITLYCCTDAFIVTAFTTFGPKYVENQYSVSAGFAGMLFGIIVVPGGAGGTLLGGWLISRFKMTTTQILKSQIMLTILIVLTGFMLFITCEPVAFAGVNRSYGNSSTMNLTSQCNQECLCDNVPFSPVCGTDNIQYYSPCHAGCLDITEKDSIKIYNNCSCITGPSPSTRTQPCNTSSCALMPLFVVLFFAAMFFLFLCTAMSTTVTMRCVSRNARSAALGVAGIMGRILGTVPGPVAFGAAFDWSCNHWQETCGQQGSCIAYDNQRMGLYIFMFSMGLKILSIFFVIACWKVYKPPALVENVVEVEERHKVEQVNGGFDVTYSNCRNGVIIDTKL